MKIHHTLLLALVCTLPSGAWAQWQWLDKDGRKVFSDRPPPFDVPEKSILKQPSGSRSAAPTAESTTPTTPTTPPTQATTASAARPPAGKDKELEQRKARADADEAAKKKAEEEKNAKIRAENCTRARNAKASFESGRPMRHANAQGEVVFMDETTRSAETRRTQEIIDADCKR